MPRKTGGAQKESSGLQPLFIVQSLVMLELVRIIGGFQVIIKATEAHVIYALRDCNYDYCQGFLYGTNSLLAIKRGDKNGTGNVENPAVQEVEAKIKNNMAS